MKINDELKNFVNSKYYEIAVDPSLSDTMLKKQFDKIIDDIDFTKYDNNKIKEILNEFENDIDLVYYVLTFVCLLNLFKKSLINLNTDIIITYVKAFSFSELNITKYQEYGNLLLDKNVVRKIMNLNQKKDGYIPLPIFCEDIIETIDLNKNKDRNLYDINKILDEEIEIRNRKTEVKRLLFSDDLSIMKIYYILKEQIENFQKCGFNLFDDEKLKDINKVKKIGKLSIENQQKFIEIVKVIDEKYVSFKEKCDMIFNIADVYCQSFKEDNIISYDFKNNRK